MSLSHALLGLLAIEPRSGYQLAKAFQDEGLARYAWQAGHTSIYPELNRLAERGLIEVTSEGARGSRTYQVTPEGREELRSWLLVPPSRTAPVRNESVLRMFLISALELPDAIAMLRRVAEHTAGEAAELRRIRSHAGPAVQPGRAGFGQLAAEYGLRQYDTVHGWALWAIDQLENAPAS